MKKVVLILCFLVATSNVFGAEPKDSIAIVNAKWKTLTTKDGLTHKQAKIDDLFGSTQSINLIEFKPSSKHKIAIAGNKGMIKTSLQARAHNARAAINGTYYNMESGASTGFYKVGKNTIDSTSVSEFALRINGAIRVHSGGIKIIGWSSQIEQNYKKSKGSVLASGPIMLERGKLSDLNSCSASFVESRHPRSAIYTKRNGEVVFLTVDGRSKGNADGISITELAYLIRVLGGRDAINLDGGGSTTLWLEGYGVVNYPSDNGKFDHEGERSVSNIIYVE